MKNSLTFKVNNGGLMNIIQEKIDGKVEVKILEKNKCYRKIIDIPAADMVMLVNYYKYIKDNDIKNDFVNPSGKNKEE